MHFCKYRRCSLAHSLVCKVAFERFSGRVSHFVPTCVLVYGLPLDVYIRNLSQRTHSAFPMANKEAECSLRVCSLVQSFKVIAVGQINPTSNSVRQGYSHYNHGFFFFLMSFFWQFYFPKN